MMKPQGDGRDEDKAACGDPEGADKMALPQAERNVHIRRMPCAKLLLYTLDLNSFSKKLSYHFLSSMKKARPSFLARP
jgi:hypothetical protein